MPAELIVALDLPSAAAIPALLERLPPEIVWYKVGLELFTAEGPAVVAQLTARGRRVFLDLKLHDIPHTVARAVAAAARAGAALLTVHAAGGATMLRAAADAARAAGDRRPRVVAVTTLTSLTQADLEAVGIRRAPTEQALALGRLALDAGLDGLVTSVHETVSLRQALGPAAILVTPGIRPAGGAVHDQARIATPAAAVAAGADYLVVGRPILEAPDPQTAARSILAEMRSARPL